MNYLDTSYIVKCYLGEPGSAEVLAWVEGQKGLSCSAYGRMEFYAAVKRHMREGRLKESGAGRVFRSFEDDCRAGLWWWLPVTEALLEKVCDRLRALSSGVYLRSADALHLTCAAEHGYRMVYSHDRHLLAAAPHFGLRGRDILSPEADYCLRSAE